MDHENDTKKEKWHTMDSMGTYKMILTLLHDDSALLSNNQSQMQEKTRYKEKCWMKCRLDRP